MGEVKLSGYICERCSHTWIPRQNSQEKPLVCPKCKSPYWDKPRKKDSKTQKKEAHGLFPTRR